jgi:hypothetical protein
MRSIKIRPLAQGWAVEVDQVLNDLVFRSGRAAEQAALRLAGQLAKVGVPSEIRVHLKDGAIGGRFFAPAFGRVRGPMIGAPHEAFQAQAAA